MFVIIRGTLHDFGHRTFGIVITQHAWALAQIGQELFPVHRRAVRQVANAVAAGIGDLLAECV